MREHLNFVGITIHPILNKATDLYAIYDSNKEDANLVGIISDNGGELVGHAHGFANYDIPTHEHEGGSGLESHGVDAADEITAVEHRTFTDALNHLVREYRNAATCEGCVWRPKDHMDCAEFGPKTCPAHYTRRATCPIINS